MPGFKSLHLRFKERDLDILSGSLFFCVFLCLLVDDSLVSIPEKQKDDQLGVDQEVQEQIENADDLVGEMDLFPAKELQHRQQEYQEGDQGNGIEEVREKSRKRQEQPGQQSGYGGAEAFVCGVIDQYGKQPFQAFTHHFLLCFAVYTELL